MLKSFWKYVGKVVFYFLLVGVAFPLVDGGDPLTMYLETQHWSSSFAIALVVGIIEFLANKGILSVPTFCFCGFVLGTATVASATMFLIISLFAIFICLESMYVQILLLALVLVVFAFAVYASFFRGVAVYKNGTVRIFKFKVKTYKDATVDDIKIEYSGNKCKIIIKVNVEDNVFNPLAISGKACGPRLMKLLEKPEQSNT